MFHWKCLVPIVGFLLAARTASAKDVEGQERVARTACLAGDFAKGVTILSELFVATEDPVYIFNQGRCFEQNHRYEDALARFQEYLRVGKKLSKSDKTGAQKHIADCQSLLAKQNGSSPAPGVAGAVRGASKEDRERAAKKACLTSNPTNGVDILTDLFIDTNDPIYIFNQGRCYEQSNQFENAVGRFREYLRKAKQATEADKDEAKAHISDCLRLLGKKDTETPEQSSSEGGRPPTKSVTASPVTVPPASLAAPVGTATESVAPAQPGSAGTGLRAAGIVTASVGAAALVAGMLLNFEYNSIVDRLPNQYNPDDESRSHTYKTLAIVGYGAGAACLTGGALLYFFGRRPGQVTVFPSVATTHLGAALGGSF
jgi:hypothetical protein